MTIRHNSALAFGLLVLAALAPASQAMAEADHAAIAKAALTKVIQPGYEAFAKNAKALANKTEVLCTSPTEAALKEARETFDAAVKGWSAVEILQFGPVNRKHRYERLFFWPDRKGLGYRQVLRALADKDNSVTTVETLAKKSVALQGLPALEVLLFAKGSDGLAMTGDDGSFRCRFATAVSGNIAVLAQEVSDAWAPDAEFTQSFVKPAPDGALYREPKDVTLELSKAFSGGIEKVRDQKLGRMLGSSAERARPRLAPFWRSEQTFPNIAGNIEAVTKLFIDAGFGELVAEQSPGVEGSVIFDLQRTSKALAAETGPVAEIVIDPEQRDKLEALRVGLKSANATATELIAQGADLNFGFNAGDGD